ncbi:MAG: (Fe-S)-binding protein [Methanosarcinales archaeon]
MAREPPSITTEKLTPVQLMEIDACTRCGECVNWCPAYDVINQEKFVPAEEQEKKLNQKIKLEYTPKERIKNWKNFINKSFGLRAMLFGPKKIPDSILQEFANRAYHCTTCGVCGTVCESGIDTVELWEALRANMVKRGNGPYGKQSFFPKLIQKDSNPYQGKQEDRLAWMPEGIEVADKAEIAYYAGCTAAFRQPELAIATVKVLDYLGLEFTMLGEDEYCCSSALIRTGQQDLNPVVPDFAKHNIEALKAKGVKKVLFACAGCFRASMIDWPRYYDGKIPFERIHISKFINDQLDAGKLEFKNSINKTITYHDPCHLGRHVGVYEEPRKVLQRIPGVTFVEMERNKELQRCCGAGGGCKAGIPDFALAMAQARIEDALNVNADILSSACPFCRRNFQDGQEASNAPIEVEDLIVLVAKALGLDVSMKKAE